MTLTEFLDAKNKCLSLLLMGETGSGKSCQLGLLAKWVKQKWDKKTLVMIADSGSGAGPFQEGIDEGYIETFSIFDTKYPVQVLNAVSQGFWPQYKESGNDFVIKVTKTPEYKIDFSDVGAIFIDSLTGLCAMLGQHFANTPLETPQAKRIFPAATVSENGHEFGSLDKPHYGLVHAQIQQALSIYFARLPLMVFAVTAQICDTPKAYVPLTIGKALNPHVPGWFKHFFHLESKVVLAEEFRTQKLAKAFGIKEDDDGSYEQRVMWFREHVSPITGIPYKAKARILLDGTQDLIAKRYPNGYQILDTELGAARFFNYLEQAKTLLAEKKAKTVTTPE